VREYLLAKAEDFFNVEGPLRSFLFVTCNTSDDNEATMEYLNRFTAIVEAGRKSDFTMISNPLGENQADDGIPSPGLKEGLKAYFEKYKFPEETEIDGLEDLKRYYQTLSQDYGYEIDVPEFTLIRQGDKLEERGRFEEARIMYEYVVERYPHDLNSYFRLAELHQRLRNYDQSIKYYEQFLQRRPEPLFQQRLASLRRYVNQSAAYAVEQAIHDSGIEAGITKYQEVKADDRSQLYFDENEFNSLGYSLTAKGMIDAAVEVFKMNVEMNPRSANAYDSLGEAYMLNGDKELAIENYKKSLDLNPDNANARQMLDRLEENSDR
jgi:tetratricopeptide (TPR) repeat protein